jgi:hypothetical protein
MRAAAINAALLLLLPLAVSGPLVQSGETFQIASKDEGRLLKKEIPQGDFQIELRVKLKEPGTLLDTVGIDAAPRGAWFLDVGGTWQAQFSLWDGQKWSAVTAPTKLAPGEEEWITVRRAGGILQIRVGGSWGRSSLETPLSGRPAYVGDYPPDAHWGSRYSIHRAALGEVEILYCGPPRMATGREDPLLRIHDPQGSISSADRQRLGQALSLLQAKKGVQAAVLAVSQSDGEKAGREAGSICHRLIAQGSLQDAYAAFVFLSDGRRLYHRSQGIDKSLPWEELGPVWDRHARSGSPAEALTKTLIELCGGASSTPPVQTDAKPAPQPTVAPGGAVKTVIGPEGGTASAGALLVSLPAGALAKPETLVIKPGVSTAFGASGWSIEFEGSDAILLKPAEISYPLPPGADPSRLAALRSLGPQSWVTMPLEIRGGKAVATTNHFCSTVLLDLGRTTVRILSSLGTAVGGTLVLAAVGAAPVTSGASLVVASTFLGAGWLAGGSAYDAAQKEGLVGPYPADGFSIWWDPRTVPSSPWIAALIDKRDGTLITFTKDSRVDTTPSIGPAGPAPKTTLTYLKNGTEVTCGFSDLAERKIPVSVLSAAYELETARRWHQSLGVSTPPTTTVYLYPKVGRTPDKENALNSGLWDGRVLGINSKELKAEPPNSPTMQAAGAHEYWHAVSTHNGFSEAWPGMEEAVAVALESLVWASPAGTPVEELMNDFLALHDWSTCSPVLRSGLFSPGDLEDPVARGYKQWPFIKHLYHTQGPGALASLVKGQLPRASVVAAFESFALASFVSDSGIPAAASLDNHPRFRPGITRTGFAGHILNQDEHGRSLRFGQNSLRKAAPASANAYVVPIPSRAEGVPECPLVVRRERLGPDHQLAEETFHAGPPSSAAVGQPNRGEVKSGKGGMVLPLDWDVPGARLPLMTVGGAALPAPASMGAAVVDPRMDPFNPLLLYRLSPPTGVTFEHLPTVEDKDGKTLFRWKAPEFGEGIPLEKVAAGYRIYGRKSGGPAQIIAEVAIKRATPPPGWRTPHAGAVMAEPGDLQAAVPIPRSRVLAFDEFAMSAVDGLMKVEGNPLESPAGWPGRTDILAALARCNAVSFRATLSFEATTTTTKPDEPPHVTSATYPVSGASVNPPDTWGFASNQFPGGRLTVSGGNFTYTWSGNRKAEGAVSAGSLMDSLNAFIPDWPFSSGSALDGTVTVSLKGQVDAQGNLTSAVLSIEHPSYGCRMSFGGFSPSTLKLEGDAVTFAYAVGEAEATAKSRDHQAWMKWTYTNGSTEFRLTKMLKTRSIRVTLHRTATKPG